MAKSEGDSGNGWMAAAGMGIASGVSGIWNGLSMKRKYKYAKKMADYEQNLQKDLNVFNQGLALDTWEKTGYDAQVQQLKKAGLNPGLMYGQAGAGGTTQSGAGTSAGQMDLPDMTTEGMAVQSAVQTALQVQQQKAQVENVKASTENIKADTANKTGGEAANLEADVQNKEIQNAIMNVQKQMAEIEKNVKNQTAEETIKQAKAVTEKAIADAEKAVIEKTISRETATAQIEQAKLETTKKTIEILAEEAGVRETSAKITKIATEISKLQNDQTIDWGKLNQEQQRTQIQQILMEFQINDPSQIKKWTDILMPLVMMGILKK